MDEVAGIYARESTYLDRYVQLGVAQGRVIAVSFPNAPDEGADDDHELLDRVEAYLQGDRDDFQDVTVALTVPTARRRVLEAVREIPYGEDASVQQVARMTAEMNPDDEGDLATVREALADNPTPLFVPDHRVRDGPSAAPPGIEQKLRSIEGF
jgi:methylated-DNA-[protein]-cysteine S-methyltransferase